MRNKPRVRLTLLSRSWCHLCDDMRQALAPLAAEYAFDLQVIDVDSDPKLERRYGEDIPVLLAGERELCRHRLDAGLVAAYLAGQAQTPAPQGQIS
jgi:thiol-disulfide isomerase/thioredoxin